MNSWDKWNAIKIDKEMDIIANDISIVSGINSPTKSSNIQNQTPLTYSPLKRISPKSISPISQPAGSPITPTKAKTSPVIVYQLKKKRKFTFSNQ